MDSWHNCKRYGGSELLKSLNPMAICVR